MGWLPANPTFDRNPLEIARAAEEEGMRRPTMSCASSGRAAAVRRRGSRGTGELPEGADAVARNLLGSSSKGHEYFLRHLLGVPTPRSAPTDPPPTSGPQEVVWRDEAAEAKLDLLVTLDFRMNGSCLHSDVVLPAATWYEKYDLSSTDMHPFVHAFNAGDRAAVGSEQRLGHLHAHRRGPSPALAARHLGVRRDLVAAPLMHDTPDEIAQPGAECAIGSSASASRPRPHDAPACSSSSAITPPSAAQLAALGPLLEQLGSDARAPAGSRSRRSRELAPKNGLVRGGPADGRPVAEPESNTPARRSSPSPERRTAGSRWRASARSRSAPAFPLADLAELSRAGDRITLADAQVQPPDRDHLAGVVRDRGATVVATRRSRSTSSGRKPWHTLSGRQQLYVDHPWMLELGEGLPAFRPPLDLRRSSSATRGKCQGRRRGAN